MATAVMAAEPARERAGRLTGSHQSRGRLRRRASAGTGFGAHLMACGSFGSIENTSPADSSADLPVSRSAPAPATTIPSWPWECVWNGLDPAGSTEPPHSHESFQALARAQLPRLLGLARRLTRDDVEDLVQEALMRPTGRTGRSQTDEAGGRWLQTILVNAYRDRLRKRARSVEKVAVPDLENFSLFRTIAEEDPFP